MTVATTVENYLRERHVDYDVVSHPHSPTSVAAARSAGVPADQMAKAVVLEDDDGYMMAVVPANRHVRLRQVRKYAGGRALGLATESELAELFKDCDTGAVPPLGEAYGIGAILDDTLSDAAEIYFESGDHEELIHMKTADFLGLQKNVKHGHFTSRFT